MSLEAFGVKNLRCLADTGLVPIRPITVLVGRNSSGKSTFLRAFPLLRQSVEAARNSPVLWYDERYVDFGSLKDAANDRLEADERSVTFRFLLRLPVAVAALSVSPVFDLSMTLAGGETPHVSRYELRWEEHKAILDFDVHGRVRGISIDDRAVMLKCPLSLGGNAYLLPTLQEGDLWRVTYQAVGTPEAIQQLRAFESHGRYRAISDVAVNAVANGSDVGDRAIVLVNLLPSLLEEADLALADFMSRIYYLRPLRVNPERAYRIQNLAVEQVDPDGKNLAMFLRSLSLAEVESFAAFTRDTLGIETSVRTTGLHAEILVKGRSAGRLVNLIDVGFGYSEVLPLAAVLWAGCVRPTIRSCVRPSLIAAEQPELHLHSAHQAKLARMLVEALSKSDGGTRIMVETHSESLINGLGKLVYDGLIKAEDIQIVLFDQDEETEQTTVRLAGYRENGALHDWPYGFLSPVAERRAPPAAAE